MRHVFILNPAAGKGDEIAPLRSKLESECKRLGADYFIYITQAPGDATEFILRECAEGGMFYGEKCRFYACGGGFDALPMAELSDGKVNIIKVKNVTRLKFLTVVKYYKDGTLPDRKTADTLCEYVSCRHAVFEFDKTQAVCVDGEIHELDRLEIDVEPGRFLFSAPRGAIMGSALDGAAELRAGV